MAIDKIIISGTLVDVSGLITNTFGNYTVKLMYKLVGTDKETVINNDILIPVKSDGTFSQDVIVDYDHKLKANSDAPIKLFLLDSNSQEMKFDTYLAGKLTSTFSLSDLTNVPVELKFLSKQPDVQSVVIAEKPLAQSNKKLKGKVVDKNAKIKIRNNQVIIYAVPKNSTVQHVIGICYTDNDGNFSIDYPIGDFEKALACVSIMPTPLLEIILESNQFPDFVYLILDNLPENITQEQQDDCACKDAKTPLLPDMEELLNNSAYSQDIGASCVNFTTPNRALEEFTYKMVVRTSDPEIYRADDKSIKHKIEQLDARINLIQTRIRSSK